MDIPSRARQLSKMMQDHSPVILTGLGCASLLTTAYLTGTATIKAVELIRGEKESLSSRGMAPNMTPSETLRLTWTLYIPPAVSAFAGITAILLSNRIGTRRAAAMATVMSAGEKAFTEYREKVAEKLGEKKEAEIRAEVSQDRVDRNPPGPMVIIGAGKHLCYDKPSDRYIESSIEDLKKAQNDTNYQLIHEGYVSLSDFYDRIEMPHTRDADEVGWEADRQLELRFDTALTPDGRPCVVFEYDVVPIRSYYRCN